MRTRQVVLLSVWLFVGAIFSVVGAAEKGPSLQLVTQGKSSYVIVVPSEPSAVERTAAQELQQHLKKMSGVTLPILKESQAERTGKDSPKILVGATQWTQRHLSTVRFSKLGHDGIVMKTLGRNLVLTGRAPRGPLYAVYTFLEDVLGCRWWTSTESFVPHRSTVVVRPLNVFYTPPLRYREAFYRDAFQGVFAARLKCNGHFERIEPEYGGHYKFAGFVHTFYSLLPPARYFKQHPEWYSLINGRRTAQRAQLCLTNEQMRQELVKNALARLKNTPGANIISISQNDWHGRCQCPKCLAVEKEEGSPSGPLLRFVNAVAQDIEKEFPHVLVETLAYQYTRKPPRHVRPRHNVIIRLCSIECSFVQPLATGEQNKRFRQDIEGWSRIAPQLFVWNYVTNFSNYILPHPNLRVLAPNIRFFVKNHVVGLFEQGDSQCAVGDFVRLRAWLLAHLMWNPQLDDKQLIHEFLQGYYGPAAPFLEQYWNVLLNAAERSGVYLRCFMPDTSSWLTLDDLNRATELYDQALKAVADDPVLRLRVRRERLPLDHVWLKRYYTLKLQAKILRKPFRGPTDPAAACEEFIRLAKQFNVGSYREGRPFSQYEPVLRQLLIRPSAAPPRACQHLAEDQWLDFQDNQFHLAREGQWTFRVDDKAASDGKAVKMPGSHREWAVSVRFPDELKDTGPWRCFVVVRCEAAPKATGTAFTTGIYDLRQKKGVAYKKVELTECRGGDVYHTFDLGVHQLRGGMYLWVAPPQRPKDVQAVYVDRVFLVRVSQTPASKN